MHGRPPAVEFLMSTRGRLLRIAAGSLLIIVGLGFIGGLIGILFLILGAALIAAPAYNVLLIGPLLGTDFRGRPRESLEDRVTFEDDPRDDRDDEGDLDDEESGEEPGRSSPES